MKGTRQGDFSRFPLDRRKRYSAVQMQQGRAHLDADWNEQADILDHRVRTATADLLGPDGAPAGEAGFRLAPDRLCLELGVDQQYVHIGGRDGCVLAAVPDAPPGFTVEVRMLARTEGQIFGCWVQREGDTQPRSIYALHLKDRRLVFPRLGVADDLATAPRRDLMDRFLHIAVSWSPAGVSIYLDAEAVAGDRQGFDGAPGSRLLPGGGAQGAVPRGPVPRFPAVGHPALSGGAGEAPGPRSRRGRDRPGGVLAFRRGRRLPHPGRARARITAITTTTPRSGAPATRRAGCRAMCGSAPA